MKNNNTYDLLDPDLFKKYKKEVLYIDKWLKIMNRSNGWHYHLDILWIIQELKNAGIKKGSTILDAGAGMGVTQFILASLGYNVISLDFTPRVKPKFSKNIFDIKLDSQELDYKHSYMDYIKYKDGSVKKDIKGIKSRNVIRSFYSMVRSLRNTIINKFETFKDHSNFGKIEFIRAAFHQIPLKDKSVDAVISVSAIEHADRKIIKENLKEISRIVRDGGVSLITTSLTHKKETIYNHKYEAWEFSESELNNLLKLNVKNDFEAIEKKYIDCKDFLNRIDIFYSMDENSDFYKKKITKIPYFPVAIKLFKF
jgi:ubiquinone/menaquinone biosynthesis C-methylase UbiE